MVPGSNRHQAGESELPVISVQHLLSMAVENRWMKGAGRTEGRGCSKHEGCRKRMLKSCLGSQKYEEQQGHEQWLWKQRRILAGGKGYLLLSTEVLLEQEWSGEWQPEESNSIKV